MSIIFHLNKECVIFLENTFMSINNNPCFVIVTVPSSSYGAAVRDAVQIHYCASRSRYLLSKSSPLFLTLLYSTLFFLSLPFSTILCALLSFSSFLYYTLRSSFFLFLSILYSTLLFLPPCFCICFLPLHFCLSLFSLASYFHSSTIQPFSFLSSISYHPSSSLTFPLISSFPFFISSHLLNPPLSLYSYHIISYHHLYHRSIGT